MKKTFLPNRSLFGRRRLKTRLSIVVVLIALALVVLWQKPLASNIVYTIVTPLIRVSNVLGSYADQTVTYMVSKARLEESNRVLKERLGSAESELSLLHSLYPELDWMIKRFSASTGVQAVIAGVLLAPPLSPYDTLILDAGALNGVSEGDLVRMKDDVVLGRIEQVFRNFSRATLFSSPGTKTPVRIGGDLVQAEAIGVGNGEFQLLLPREYEIHRGDPVLFPDTLPPIVGVVQSVEFRDVDFLQLISFRSPLNLAALRYVVIETETSIRADNE